MGLCGSSTTGSRLMSVEGVPSVDDVAAVIQVSADDPARIDPLIAARAVHALYAPHLIHAGRYSTAAWGLREIARIGRHELNPDGVDQAAVTAHLIAVETLQAIGEDVPDQRVSVADGPGMAGVCICGRSKNESKEQG